MQQLFQRYFFLSFLIFLTLLPLYRLSSLEFFPPLPFARSLVRAVVIFTDYFYVTMNFPVFAMQSRNSSDEKWILWCSLMTIHDRKGWLQLGSEKTFLWAPRNVNFCDSRFWQSRKRNGDFSAGMNQRRLKRLLSLASLAVMTWESIAKIAFDDE